MTTSTTNKHTPLESCLIFKDFHFAKINDLAPESIKKSAKASSVNSLKYVSRSRDKLKATTAQNWIVKSLGFKSGFSSYKEKYQDEILPFLKEHGLERRENVFSYRREGFCLPLKRLTRQMVSERLFFGSNIIPSKIFTGYNFPFDTTISDGHYYINCTPHNQNSDIAKLGIKAKHRFFGEFSDDLEIVKQHRDIRLNNCQYEFINGRKVIDIILGKYLLDLDTGFNLIGDALIEPTSASVEVQLYSSDPNDNFKNECLELTEIGKLFGERIRDFTEGWLEVIPFNENLIFLKGKNGEYDFVYKNMRDAEFVFNFDNGALKLPNLPSCVNDYDFKKWLYFSYQGQRELDEHLAEQHYYKHGGTAQNYPNGSAINKDFYISNGSYIQSNNAIKRPFSIEIPFTKVSGTQVMATDVITIEQFEYFLTENPDYKSYRAQAVEEQLIIDNQDTDKTLPIACNWYDALAFLKWFEDKTNICVKLMSKEEFCTIRNQAEALPDTYRPKIDLVPIVTNKMHNCLFPDDMKWVVTPDGIKFSLLNNFAEWVMERTCIRSGGLLSFYWDNNFRAMALNTTGAYKQTKIGFRMCYLDNNNSN